MMANAFFHPTEHGISDNRRITLEQLRVFIAVARTKSFHTAGKQLGRTQSAITQSIKNLEEHTGCRLVERRPGSVLGLTPDGEKVLHHAVDVIHKVDLLVQSVQRPELQGYVRFGIPLSIGTAELNNALAEYMAANKKLRVRLISDTSMHLAAMLENGALDAAIMNEGATGAPDGPPILTHILYEEPLVWVLNPRMTIDWAEDMPLIAFSEGSPWTHAAVTALNNAGIAYYYAYVSTSFESICGAVSEGIGITALPLSKIPEKYASVADNGPLPPLPQIRTVIRARTENRLVLEFCSRIEQLPIFARSAAK